MIHWSSMGAVYLVLPLLASPPDGVHHPPQEEYNTIAITLYSIRGYEKTFKSTFCFAVGLYVISGLE